MVDVQEQGNIPASSRYFREQVRARTCTSANERTRAELSTYIDHVMRNFVIVEVRRTLGYVTAPDRHKP